MLIWVNDELVEASDAAVSVFDHGLTVGDGVFESVKVVGGVPFALRRHLDRLETSASRMALPLPDRGSVERGCADVVKAYDGEDARLRITYTAGIGPLGSDRGAEPGTLVVAATALPTRPREETVAVVPWTRNERGALAGIKSTSYAENVLALAHARGRDAGEALFADTRARLSEGTGSNVFVVVDGRVSTPTLDSGCLAGVTRALVLEWCDVAEVDVPLDVLDTADEVFLTSTTRDVQPVTTIQWENRSRDLPVGPVTETIAETFRRRAAADPEP